MAIVPQLVPVAKLTAAASTNTTAGSRRAESTCLQTSTR